MRRLRKELWFGFSLMAIIVVPVVALTPWGSLTDGHLGLIMLALIVVAIMLGFPTAFTLMGMGVFFAWLAYRGVDPAAAGHQVLNLMVQRAYGVMSNDVLIAVPLFVFMGYVVERAALIDRLFHSLHLAMSRVPGSLAVATIITCAVFATATGIVGAVVTLMGLLAFPAMLRAGYNVQVSAGAITAGGCLGIMIPPSILLIVYGATAGVSVVQLYAGALIPGMILAGLYVAYVVLLAKWKPRLMPPLPESEQRVDLPPHAVALARHARNPLIALCGAFAGGTGVPRRTVCAQLFIVLIPALFIATMLAVAYQSATAPAVEYDASGLIEVGGEIAAEGTLLEQETGLIGVPPAPPEADLKDPATEGAAELSLPSGAEETKAEGAPTPVPSTEAEAPAATPSPVKAERLPAPGWFWIMLGIGLAALGLVYGLSNWQRLQIFKMLLTSLFPLASLVLAVLGSIVFGLATPAEAAALGAFGGIILTAAYRFAAHWSTVGSGNITRGAALLSTAKELGIIVKESSFLTAKTSAMVCWLFVGSAIFSAAFALLGGQEIIERWVLSLDMTPLQFMILAQFIIFILGWPLEWTEIIVIFMPIFIPMLPHFDIDPLFFGILVALNLQTAFLSPPVAMAAFYLKGVAPRHVTLNQIFAGMLPFMGIVIICLVLLYLWPGMALWLPQVVYGR
jgi:TRAP-type mannitol/chloroaromatic compound transport system permease large subunit